VLPRHAGGNTHSTEVFDGRPATPDVAIGDARGHYLRETSNAHGHDNVTVIHIGRSAIHVQLTGAVGILE
jgi:hypothetical protein